MSAASVPVLDRTEQPMDMSKIDRQEHLAKHLPSSPVPLISAAADIVPETQTTIWSKALGFLERAAPEFLKPAGMEQEMPKWTDYPKLVPEDKPQTPESLTERLKIVLSDKYIGKDPLAGELFVEAADKLLFNHDIDVFKEDMSGIDAGKLLEVDPQILAQLGLEEAPELKDLVSTALPSDTVQEAPPVDMGESLTLHANVQTSLPYKPSEELFGEQLTTSTDTEEIRGFPQGLGLSPILFSFVMVDALIREHFAKRYPKAVVIAYADDFLLFSKRVLQRVEALTEPLVHSGLRFSAEKSRPIKLYGRWLTKKFKFLGISYYPSTDLLSGTPRSGGELVMDKLSATDQFIDRDKDLRKIGPIFQSFSDNEVVKPFGSPIAKKLEEKDYRPSPPQVILDNWGRGVWPFSILPISFIDGRERLSSSLLSRLRRAILEEKSHADSLSWLESFEGYFAEVRNPHAWLRSRLSGTILSRLHSKSWQSLTTFPDRSLRSHKRAHGKAWLDLVGRREDNLGIFNSSSYASRDMLTHMRRPKGTRRPPKEVRRYDD